MRSFLACLLLCTCTCLAQSDPRTGKILEWGWGTPPPIVVQKHITEMEKLPFDGLVMNLYANGHHDPSTRPDRQAAFTHLCFYSRPIKPENYTESINALKNTHFKRFTDNFLLFDVTPGHHDWFDDFSAVYFNARFLARTAKQTGIKGIVLDTETYDGEVFNYPRLPQHNQHTLAEYRKQVRLRGREFMRAINMEYPDIKILVSLAYSMAHGDDGPNNTKYGLLPDFLDGMNEAASPQTVLYDGWEYSYNYTTEKEFVDVRKIIRETTPNEWSAVPEKVKEHWRASFGLWIDYGEDAKWNQQDFSKNFFSPQQFSYSLHQALCHTDRYVWIYSHHANWWQGQVPQPYLDALTNARHLEVMPSAPSK